MMNRRKTLKEIDAEIKDMSPAEALKHLEQLRTEGILSVNRLIERYEKLLQAGEKEARRLEEMSK